MATVRPRRSHLSTELIQLRCPRCGRHQLYLAAVPGTQVLALRCKGCKTIIFTEIDPKGELKTSWQQAAREG